MDDPRELLLGLDVDVSGHWSTWPWKRFPLESYEFARLEEYRDRSVLAYHLYNRIGLEHARRLLDGLPRSSRVLDAGGGTGRKAIPLAQDGYCALTVVDRAPGWLRLAAEKAEAAGVASGLTLLEGDLRRLDGLEDDPFEAVLCLGGAATYCGDTAAALRAMARVLKPGGRLLADGIHSRLATLRYLAQQGKLGALEELASLTPATGEAGPGLGGSGIGPESLASLAEAAGLSEVAVGAEFMFLPDDSLPVDQDLARWERVVLDLELAHCRDPRFLGTGSLVLWARKPERGCGQS